MDAREDLPKVSIETEQDWRRIQRNLSNAFLERLDKELEARGWTGDKDELLPHANQVRRCQQRKHLPTHVQPRSFWRHSLILRAPIYASTVGRQKNRLKLKKTTTWSRSMKPSTGIFGRYLIKDSSGTRTLQIVEERAPKRSRLWFSLSKIRTRWTLLRTRLRMTL